MTGPMVFARRSHRRGLLRGVGSRSAYSTVGAPAPLIRWGRGMGERGPPGEARPGRTRNWPGRPPPAVEDLTANHGGHCARCIRRNSRFVRELTLHTCGWSTAKRRGCTGRPRGRRERRLLTRGVPDERSAVRRVGAPPPEVRLRRARALEEGVWNKTGFMQDILDELIELFADLVMNSEPGSRHLYYP